MYPPRKESEAVNHPCNEVRDSIFLGLVALCLAALAAALAKFKGIGSTFLFLGIGAWLRAAMFRAGLKPKTQTIVVGGLTVAALAFYYITRQR